MPFAGPLLTSGNGGPVTDAAVATVAESARKPGFGRTFAVPAEVCDVGVGTADAADGPDGPEEVNLALDFEALGGKTAGGSTGLNGSYAGLGLSPADGPGVDGVEVNFHFVPLPTGWYGRNTGTGVCGADATGLTRDDG